MTSSLSRMTLSCITAVVLLNCSSAYAASGSEAAADRNIAAASQQTDNNLATVVVATSHRETNLRKTATSIIVMGMDTPKNSREHR